MALPIIKSRIGSDGRLENQEIFDTECVKAATATQVLSFFSNPVGQADQSALLAPKTYADSNVQQANQLPAGQEMTCQALSIRVVPVGSSAGSTPTPLTIDTLNLIYSRCQVLFQISSITIYQGPLWNIGSGVNLSFSGNSTADTKLVFSNGNNHPSSVHSLQSMHYKRVPVPGSNPAFKQTQVTNIVKAYPTIDSSEQFSLVLSWPSPITLASGQNAYIQASIGGLFLRPM